MGPKVGIYTSNHAIDAEERIAGGCYAKKVIIGNHVWVGAGVQVNQGVTIGCNSIISSGSVVTKDIPDHVIATGVPCKVIREITEEGRDRLSSIRKEWIFKHDENIVREVKEKGGKNMLSEKIYEVIEHEGMVSVTL